MLRVFPSILPVASVCSGAAWVGGPTRAVLAPGRFPEQASNQILFHRKQRRTCYRFSGPIYQSCVSWGCQVFEGAHSFPQSFGSSEICPAVPETEYLKGFAFEVARQALIFSRRESPCPGPLRRHPRR